MQIALAVVIVVIAGIIWFATRAEAAPPLPPPPLPPVFTCPHCGAEFATEAELNAHIETAHPTEPVVYTCPYCGDTFSSAVALAAHIRVEHPEPPPEPPPPPPPPPPLPPSVANLWGIVIAKATENPLSGVKVTATPGNFLDSTDSKGEYRIEGLTPGAAYTVTFEKEDYVTQTKQYAEG